MQFPIYVYVSLLPHKNNILIFIILISTFYSTECASPADIIVKCDRVIMNLYKNLTEQSGSKLVDAMNLHLSTVKNILENLEKNDTSVFKEFRPMRGQSWLDYFYYDLTYNKIQELRHLFKWTSQEARYFESIWRVADEKWNTLLEYCYDYLEKTGMMHRIKNSFFVNDDDTFSDSSTL